MLLYMELSSRKSRQKDMGTRSTAPHIGKKKKEKKSKK
jgi:hypothetical protein